MKKLCIILVLIALLVLMVRMVCYTVDESSYVLVTQFGKPVSTQKEAGLRFKLPWQTGHRIDRRLQLYETPLITYVTGDRQLVVLQVFVCWEVDAPLTFFKAVRTFDNATQKLDDVVTAAFGARIGTINFSNLVSTVENEVKISESERIIAQQVNEGTRREYGLKVSRIGISRFALPEDNVRSVWEKIKAERLAIANEYRALGWEQATKIRAEANKQKSEILAEAYKKSEILKGEGEAQAAAIYAEAYSEAPEFFKFLRTLETYKKIFQNKTTLVMSSDSDLLQYLNKKTPETSGISKGTVK